jgi:hypothetical protein
MGCASTSLTTAAAAWKSFRVVSRVPKRIVSDPKHARRNATAAWSKACVGVDDIRPTAVFVAEIDIRGEGMDFSRLLFDNHQEF